MSAEVAAPRLRLLIGAAELGADGLRRIPVAMAAKGFKGKQKFSVTRDDLGQIVKNFRKRGTGDLVIDYDHSTEFAAGSGEAAPAAGWLKAVDDAPDAAGVLWGKAEFTDRAAKMLEAREYKYVSPVIVWGARDKETGDPQGTTMTSVAITNSPLMEKLPAITFSEAGWEIDRGDAAITVAQEATVTKLIMADRVARTVRAIADDGKETILTLEGLEAVPTVIRMSDVKRGAEGTYDFGSVKTDGEVLIAGDVFRAVMVQGELDAAVKAGKITPAQRPFYEKMAFSDVDGFRALVATMKPAVDFKEHGIATGAEGGDELAKVTAALESKVTEKLAANPKLQHHEALKLVASENRALNIRYTQLSRQRMGGGND